MDEVRRREECGERKVVGMEVERAASVQRGGEGRGEQWV